MIPASFMNDRVGPICRTVEDTARVFAVISGYDPKDELTAFSFGYTPPQPYVEAARPSRLDGLRIGVLREYMDKSLFTTADAESIDIVERAVPTLAALGAEIVDPGPGGALLQQCFAKYAPHVHQAQFIAQHSDLFPPNADHVPLLVDLFFDSSRFPGGPSVRGLGPAPTKGDRRYVLNRYLQARGDANIKSIDDLIAKSSFYEPAVGYQDKRATLVERNKETTLDVAARLQLRDAMRQLVMQCMGEQSLDALTYPTGNIPAPKLGAPNEPTVNGRPSNAWSILGQQGFPTITVPAGFTTQVYDRVPDPDAPAPARAGGEDGGATPTKLVGPVAARLPVGIDFLARPFDEPTLFKIAAAYEDATRHREVPPGFGALAGKR